MRICEIIEIEDLRSTFHIASFNYRYYQDLQLDIQNRSRDHTLYHLLPLIPFLGLHCVCFFGAAKL